MNTEKQLYNARILMDEYYTRLKNCTSTTGKKNNFEKMLEIYHKYEEIQNEWILTYTGHYNNRFQKKKITKKKNKKYAIIQGLYLIGNTYFNPFTKEEFYWIKVGKSTDIYKRILTYKTHNPMIWEADSIELNTEQMNEFEKLCHRQLKEICKEIAENTNEWFMVSRETYLEICEKKWNYFYCIQDKKMREKILKRT